MEPQIPIYEKKELESDNREEYYIISSPAGSNYNKVHESSVTNHEESSAAVSSQTSPSSTSYRIPSSVFSRSKSNAPTEWSVTSNESLFSLYPGNTSFAGDQFSHILSMPRNDEANRDSFFSGPLLNFSEDQSKFTSNVSDNKPEEIGEEVSKHYRKAKENGDDLIKEVSLAKGIVKNDESSISDESGASFKSFAFPVLTTNDSSVSIIRGGGTSTNRGKHSQPQTPKGMKLHNSQSYYPQPTREKESEKEKQIGAPASNVACCTWWSCFPSARRNA